MLSPDKAWTYVVRLETPKFKSNSVTDMLLNLEDIKPISQTVLLLGINERMHKNHHSKFPDGE